MPRRFSPSGVAEADVRVLVRLLGDTAMRSGGHRGKKTYLLDQLSELVGADEWRCPPAWLPPAELEMEISRMSTALTETAADERRIVSHCAVRSALAARSESAR